MSNSEGKRLILREHDGNVLSNLSIDGKTQGEVLQMRHDAADCFDVRPGEGYFTVEEGGSVIHKYPVTI